MTQPDDKKTEQPPSTEDKDNGGKLTAGSLRNMIREEIKNVADGLFPKGDKSGDGKTDDKPSGDTIKSEVAKQLGFLKAKEDREARDKEIDGMLEEHRKAKAEPQKPPVERRRVEKLMGWGD